MAQTIKLKRSATQNAVPSTSSLALGELAINTYDGKLFIKKNVSGTESIVTIGEVGANSIGPTELASTAVTAGSYGSTSAIPVITIDADGRITSASTATISGLSANSVTSTEIAANAVGISELNVSDGTDGQVLTTDGSGNLAFEDQSGGAASATAFSTNIASGDGSTTAFTLSESPSAESKIIAFINGVFQNQDAYTISGTTLTFDTAPISGTNNVVVYVIGDVYSGESVLISNFSGNGTTTAFTLANNPGNENNTQVYIDGVYQQKTTYSVSGTTLTFSSAPPTGTNNIEVVMLTSTTVNTPAAGSVVTASMADDSVTASKIVSSAVTTAKIADSNVTTAKIADDAVTIGKIADAALVIESEGISSNDNDTTLPTSAAVKDYVDTQVAGKDALSELSGDTDDVTEGSTNLYYTDARVGTYISGNRTYGNITTTGYLAGPSTFTIDPAEVGNNTGTLVIAGNLQVDGTTTTVNSTTLTVDDKLITLGSGSANAGAANGAGIEVDITGSTNPSLTYDGTNDEWDFNKDINVSGNITAQSGGLIVGTSDTTGGVITVYGNGTGNNEGGEIQLKMAADHDSTYDHFRLDVVNDTFRIGRTGTTDLSINSSGNATFAGTISSGRINTSDGIADTGQAGSATIFNESGSTADFRIESDTKTHMFFLDGGLNRIGINTASPTHTLHILNEVSSDTIDETEGLVKMQSSGGNGMIFGTIASSPYTSYIQSAYVVDTSIAQYNLALNPIGGNVGIGTDNPTHLLHLESSTPTIKFTESDTSTNAFIQNTGGNLRLYADDGDSRANTIIGFHIDASEKMIIDSSGALGLGTTPPTTNIHPQFFIGTESVILGSTGGALDIGNNLYYNSGWKHRTTGAASLLDFDGSGNLVFYNVASAAANSAATLDEALRITSDGKLGIGTGTSPASGLHVKSDASGTSGITTTLERTDSASSWLRLKGNSTNSFQLGSTTGGIEFYDDASSTYVAKINNDTNDHNLQKWCYAEFDVYDNGSADAWEEKANLAANVYSLYGANINPGKYSNNLYYVGVGRENVSEAYVEFKVDLVEARSIYAYFGVSNSADGSTRYARLWYSYDGEIYTQVDNNSFGAGGGSASYTLNLTSVLHHGDGDFSGSVYFRCGLMDNASSHTTLIGWTDFKFKAFAESMTFDGRYKRGSSSTSLVDNSGGGQETNFVPKVPYVHTFTLTSAGASSIETNNGGLGQFTTATHSYLNKEIFQIVSSPTHGIQCLTEGTIFYTVHQDLRTTGSTSYARVYVQRVTSTASASINVGLHLTTNTGNEWDSISGQGSFDVVAGDIIRFSYAATGINSMDAGSWSYYTLMMIPHTTSAKGNAQGNSSFPFAGGI